MIYLSPLEILQKYLQQEANRKNLKQENIQTMGFYKTKKELDLEMGKHRRELLQKVAVLYKQEREEFYQKYRIF